MKVVINRCYGGFGLSSEAIMHYANLKGIKLVSQKDDMGWNDHFYKDEVKDENYFSINDIPRDDPCLVQTVEELGEDADGACASLAVVEIPDGIEWEIEEYDGAEWVSEKHRTWS